MKNTKKPCGNNPDGKPRKPQRSVPRGEAARQKRFREAFEENVKRYRKTFEELAK